MAFNNFDTGDQNDLIRSDESITDARECFNFCHDQPNVKTYFLDGKTKECRCLSNELVENENGMDALGAPKYCPADLVQRLCVSSY